MVTFPRRPVFGAAWKAKAVHAPQPAPARVAAKRQGLDCVAFHVMLAVGRAGESKRGEFMISTLLGAGVALAILAACSHEAKNAPAVAAPALVVDGATFEALFSSIRTETPYVSVTQCDITPPCLDASGVPFFSIEIMPNNPDSVPRTAALLRKTAVALLRGNGVPAVVDVVPSAIPGSTVYTIRVALTPTQETALNNQILSRRNAAKAALCDERKVVRDTLLDNLCAALPVEKGGSCDGFKD